MIVHLLFEVPKNIPIFVLLGASSGDQENSVVDVESFTFLRKEEVIIIKARYVYYCLYYL